MLVLSRKKGESLTIGTNIEVRVLKIGPDYVKLGIGAPGDVPIVREEAVDKTPKKRN